MEIRLVPETQPTLLSSPWAGVFDSFGVEETSTYTVPHIGRMRQCHLSLGSPMEIGDWDGEPDARR